MADKIKYKVIDLEKGMYEYDTLFVECDNTIIQIPIKRGIIEGSEIVDKILYNLPLDKPIDKIKI